MNANPYPTWCTKIKAKWITDLNIKPITINIKLLRGNIKGNLCNLRLDKNFLDKTPQA